jgi:hypothetical protein
MDTPPRRAVRSVAFAPVSNRPRVALQSVCTRQEETSLRCRLADLLFLDRPTIERCVRGNAVLLTERITTRSEAISEHHGPGQEQASLQGKEG